MIYVLFTLSYPMDINCDYLGIKVVRVHSWHLFSI